jgi:hypothetical protein
MQNPFRSKTKALAVVQQENDTLKSELTIRTDNLTLFEERLAELELALEDQGWNRLAGSANTEFSRAGLKIVNYLARIYFLKNPLIRRGVLTQTQFVFGQGVNIQAKHPLVDEVVQAFLDDPKNKAELTRQQAYSIKESELQCFANLFFVFFVNKYTGAVRIRTISMTEITEILTNPDDMKEPQFYLRQWTSGNLDATTDTQDGILSLLALPSQRCTADGDQGHREPLGPARLPCGSQQAVRHALRRQ